VKLDDATKHIVIAAMRSDLRSAAFDFGHSAHAFNYGHSAPSAPDTTGDPGAAWVRLHNAAVDYVSALLTNGANAGRFGGDRTAWLKFVQSNPHAFAGVLEDLKFLRRVP